MEIAEFFCEIKCADLLSAILSRLEALDFDFSAVLHFLKAESYPLEMAKNGKCTTFNSEKLISRKI